ncbi:hypothetical protein ACJA25_03020 [Mycoplasmopsis hyopharyngis]|uniref:hypothetical protein n=1 Tax=Mycoplasmopsis hyopharyngis TaxID=29558 RepID=UPI00387381B9
MQSIFRKNLSDYQIFTYLSQWDNQQIAKFISVRHSKDLELLSKRIIKSYSNIPLEESDIFNLCLDFAVKCSKKFDPKLNIPFLNFLLYTTKLSVQNVVKYWLRKRRINEEHMLHWKTFNEDDVEVFFDLVDHDSLLKIETEIDNIDYQRFVDSLTDDEKKKLKIVLNAKNGKVSQLYTTNKINKMRSELSLKLKSFYKIA